MSARSSRSSARARARGSLLAIDDESVLPLRTDTRVAVRQHTPVGENYIAITAGQHRGRSVESGDTLPVSQSDEFVDVDRLLSVLKGRTRERARQTVQSLGGALAGRGREANDLIGDTSLFLRSSGRVVDVLHRDRKQASSLVDQLGDVAAAIGQRDAAIGTIARQGLASLRAVASRDAALRDTLSELPETLRRARRTTATLQSVSRTATPVIDDATVALRAVQSPVRRLAPVAESGRGVLRELDGAAPRLEQTLTEVAKLSKPLPGALPRIHKAICEVAPIARYMKPYLPEALHILIGLGSSSNSYDATGHLIRLAPILSENSVSGMPEQVSSAVSDLLYGGLIGKLAGTSLNFDPYPKPGSLGKTVATSNVPLGPDRVPGTGFKYPRVEADC